MRASGLPARRRAVNAPPTRVVDQFDFLRIIKAAISNAIPLMALKRSK
jgi:hypothetical protein